jgi:ABC-type Mn2+/Zn2+ transport system ATPase subunit
MTSAALARTGGPAVEARSLSVGHGERVVIAGLDFALERGRTLALVGANGSGKTTLLKTVASLLAPVSGEIHVLGAAPGAFPARVAYLGQFHATGFVLPLRTIDVVRMGRFASLGLLGRASREDERSVERAMEVMGVSRLRNEPLDMLSGGQRQRVFIAQALARGAELLLLDEPAANLDRGARETYRKVVRDAASAGCSAVVATHDIEEAAGSDDAMLLAQRVVAFGNPREVLTAEALLSTFGVVARQGEGGVLLVEDEHDHGLDGEGWMP